MARRGAGTGTSTRQRNLPHAGFTSRGGIKARRATVERGVKFSADQVSAPGRDRRWPALFRLCAGILMVILDGTLVNVALPSIQSEDYFTPSNPAWVINSY